MKIVTGSAESRIYVAWDNANTHVDDEVEAVVRGAAGRLVLLYLPTYSPWLNPIEMLWHHFRREVTHCELFESVKAMVEAAYDFFARHNQCRSEYARLLELFQRIYPFVLSLLDTQWHEAASAYGPLGQKLPCWPSF